MRYAISYSIVHLFSDKLRQQLGQTILQCQNPPEIQQSLPQKHLWEIDQIVIYWTMP